MALSSEADAYNWLLSVLKTAAAKVGVGSGIPVASDADPLEDGTADAGTSSDFSRGDHVHPTDTSLAPLASPALTGTPTAPTAAAGTNTTQLATTAFVAAATAGLGGSLTYATGHVSLARTLPNATWTTVWFDTADTDTAGGLNTGTGVYTIKVAGTYLVMASVGIDNSGVGAAAYTGQQAMSVLRGGGSSLEWTLSQIDVFGNRSTVLTSAQVVPGLAVNDTLQIRVYQTRDTAPGSLGYQAGTTHFALARIGS